MKKILIGSSLNEVSDINVKVGLEFAQKVDYSPVVLHADKLADFDTLDTIFSSMNMDVHEKYISKIIEGNQKELRQQLARVNNNSIEVEQVVLTGDPADCLIEMAKENDVDLISIGYNKDKNFVESFMGGISESVLHRSPISTLVVKNDDLFPIRNIVVAYDFSHFCNEALVWAETLSKNFSAKVHLVNVVPCYYEGYHVAHTYSNRLNDLMSEVIEETAQKVEKRLQEVASAHFSNTQFQVKSLIDKEGSISTAITSYCDSVHADLIIVGSHKKGKVSEILLGSVCNKLVKKSKKSVLIAK